MMHDVYIEVVQIVRKDIDSLQAPYPPILDRDTMCTGNLLDSFKRGILESKTVNDKKHQHLKSSL